MTSPAMMSTASGIVMASTTRSWLSLAAPIATSAGAITHQYQTGTSAVLMTRCCRRWISASSAAASVPVGPLPAGWGCCMSLMVVSC